jgi:Tol biopolymer transport system component
VQVNDAVFSAAISPDGKTVAFSATWGTRTPHLVLATWNGRALSEPREFRRIRSCELSWRPDGGELALDQRGDTCDSSENGSIARFDPRHNSEVELTTAGQNVGSPAWSPTS